MADPKLTELDDRELENQTVDAANFPYQKQRAMLRWTGTAWEKWNGAIFNSLVTSAYDYVSLGYTGSNLTTIVFKTGGSGGTTVATLTLAYTGSRLDSVTKS